MPSSLSPSTGLARQLLEPAGCGIEALCYLVLLDAGAETRRALVALAAYVITQALRLAAGLDQAVGNDETGHHEKADVANIANRIPDARHLLVEHEGERGQMLLLAIVALHGVGPPVHLDDHLGHSAPLSNLLAQHAPDPRHSLIDAP